MHNARVPTASLHVPVSFLGDFPFGAGGVLQSLTASLTHEDETEDGGEQVEAHEDEKGVDADVVDHVGTGEGEAEGRGPMSQHARSLAEGANASGEDFRDVGPG